MSDSLRVCYLDQGARFKASFNITLSNFTETGGRCVSPVYTICNGLATFQLLIRQFQDITLHLANFCLIKGPYTFKITKEGPQSYVLRNLEQFNVGANTWQLISDEHTMTVPDGRLHDYTLKIKLVSCTMSPYKMLFEDSEFCDFELRGEGDGSSVAVHRNVLATSSPVLKTMLLGDWKERKEGYVQLAGVSHDTLQHFKTYMYLGQLPDDTLDCAKLFPLAELYDMPQLEADCALKISTDFKPELTWEWLEYCVENKDEKLLLTMLENIDMVKIEALRQYFSKK